jgi:hydroxymethylpyrimidine pyrophosphatase-like HAD family hydrolase
MKGIDPGRPGVPSYGRRLYHLRHNLLLEARARGLVIDTTLDRMVERKASDADLSQQQRLLLIDKASAFLTKLSTAVFKGIVIDYDNTVIIHNDTLEPTFISCLEYIVRFAENGIRICFATGRGKSIRDQLLNLVPESLWPEIFVCYYNGAYALSLDKELDSGNESINDALQRVHDMVSQEIIFRGVTQSLRTSSIMLEGSARNLRRASSFLTQKIMSGELNNVKLVKSDHSVDVIQAESSKINAVGFLEGLCGGDVLCIGDSGDETGNDYEMLCTEYSLSVGTVSVSTEACWNISSLGLNGPSATLEYLSKLQFVRDGLKFRRSYVSVQA